MMGAALNASHRTAPDEVTTRASAAPPLLLVVRTLVQFMCISLHEGDKGAVPQGRAALPYMGGSCAD